MAIIEKMKTRFDGFVNAITSVGTSRDPGYHNKFTSSGRLSRSYIDSVYAESAVFAKIIDLYPETALAQWITFNHDKINEINEKIEDLDLISHLIKAGIKDRKDGGCVIFCDVNDGQEADTPLNLERVQSFNSLKIIEGRYVQPVNPNRANKAKDGLYKVDNGDASIVIHESRLLMFEGIEVSDDYAFENEGICGATVSKRIDQSVARYELAQSNITALSSKLLVGVWKLDGLNELIQTSEDSDADLKARFKTKTMGVSHLNDVVIDGADDYKLLAPNLSGLDQIISPTERNLVTVSGIPHTTLLGETSGGLGSTGESQKRDWHKTIANYQRLKYKSVIQKVLNMITALLKTEPVREFIFPPLDVPSEKEKSETRLNTARADSLWINDGVKAPEEVRQRFEGGFTIDHDLNDAIYNTEIDLSALDEQTTATA